MFSLESPHRSTENIQYIVILYCFQYGKITVFNIKKEKDKNILNYPIFAAMGFFSKGLKNEFEKVMVKEPSVFNFWLVGLGLMTL